MFISGDNLHFFLLIVVPALSIHQEVLGEHSKLKAGHLNRQRRNALTFNDPSYPKSFYMNEKFGVTMNILKTWNNYTGKGITICVNDPMGVEYSHQELSTSYDSRYSYDFKDNDTIPEPSNMFDHGTQMAGLAIARPNNNFCSVGVAYDAKFSAVKFAGTGPTEEYGIRESFKLYNDENDIFLCSWGPGDLFGSKIGYMYPTVKPAIKRAAEKGRKGKGNIITFSTGNGGTFNKSCSTDEYLSSIYTISISVVTGKNVASLQNEKCSSITAVTYARDGNLGIDYPHDKMPTATVGGQCAETSTSSSAANAVAAGILALVLEANPNLGWRDMQHLIAQSSCSEFPSVPWKTNKAGFKVSDDFGFGLMDAYALTQNAKSWKNVESQRECTIKFTSAEPIHGVNTLTKIVDMTTWPASCGGESNKIVYLEHVVVVLSLEFTKRRNLEMEIHAPTGTKSINLRGSNMDQGSMITNLQTMSLHHWGENPAGKWTMKLRNVRPDINSKGTLYNWSLKFYGTLNDPMKSNRIQKSMIKINSSGITPTDKSTPLTSPKTSTLLTTHKTGTPPITQKSHSPSSRSNTMTKPTGTAMRNSSTSAAPKPTASAEAMRPSAYFAILLFFFQVIFAAHLADA